MTDYIREAEEAFRTEGSSGPRVAGHICKAADDIERAISYYRQSKLGDWECIDMALELGKPELAAEIYVEKGRFTQARELAHEHGITLDEKVLEQADLQEDREEKGLAIYRLLQGQEPADRPFPGKTTYATKDDYLEAVAVAKSVRTESGRKELLDEVASKVKDHYRYTEGGNASYGDRLSYFAVGTILEEAGHRKSALSHYSHELHGERHWLAVTKGIMKSQNDYSSYRQRCVEGHEKRIRELETRIERLLPDKQS